jgi:hypothetical protein
MEAGARLFCVLACAAAFAAACASPPAKTVEPASPPPPVGKPPPGGEPTATTPSHEFVASEELYRMTFREVQEVVAAITRIIAAGDYDSWLSYLTAEYVASRSSPHFLADASNSAVLKANGIVLKNLRDYFNHVVVRSRLQATLDDIQFIDETHVKAIALVQGTPVILYYLVNEKGHWKVEPNQTGKG